jgi:hypothetical protein
MQSLIHVALIDSVPMRDLLLLLGVFALAALLLFALSVEAGNYPKISRIICQVREALRHGHTPYSDHAEGSRMARH